MRLITHNMIQCSVKNCNTNNFPLRFENIELAYEESELNLDFLVNMLPKLEYTALRNTALELGFNTLPEQMPENADSNELFLNELHKLLMDTHVQSGIMKCMGCNHIYPIKDGIPNMLLAEHEL